MTLLLTGLKAMDSMASDGRRSVVVVQVGFATVKSLVCQIPPFTVAAYRCFVFIGSTAMALMAPAFKLWAAVGPITLAPFGLNVPPSVIGAGPSAIQVGTPNRPTEGRIRLSRGSNTSVLRSGGRLRRRLPVG